MSQIILPANRGGSLSQYYHFLLGYLLPALTEERLQTAWKYLFYDCGPFNEILRGLGFGILPRDYCRLVEQIYGAGRRSALLAGITRRYVSAVPGFDSEDQYPTAPLAEQACLLLKRFGLEDLPAMDNVLVIGRRKVLHRACLGPNADLSEAPPSVPNIYELAAWLTPLASVHFLTLEGLSLPEQVRLFRSSRIVITQSGDALGNLVWMRPGTYVVEIEPRRGEPSPRYAGLAARLGVRHVRVEQADHRAPLSEAQMYQMRRLVAACIQRRPLVPPLKDGEASTVQISAAS